MKHNQPHQLDLREIAMVDYKTNRAKRFERLVACGLMTKREAGRRATKPEKTPVRTDAVKRRT